MSRSTPSKEAVDLAQALMAEITGRLEDLAALAAARQLASSPVPELADELRRVTDFAAAHSSLLSRPPRPKPRKRPASLQKR